MSSKCAVLVFFSLSQGVKLEMENVMWIHVGKKRIHLMKWNKE